MFCCQIDSKTHFACLGISFHRNETCDFFFLFICSSELMWFQKLQVGKAPRCIQITQSKFKEDYVKLQIHRVNSI